MKLENSLEKIKEAIFDEYKSNLAGILILGSANTGEFKEGESDINTMIFVKDKNELSFENELKDLTEKLKEYKFQSQYFHSLKSIRDYIQKRKSFATYLIITSDDGSRVLYTTPEFEETRNWFKEHPFTKEEIKEHIKEKDKFELEGYMYQKSEKQFAGREYRTTQNLFFHNRRKVQIMSYFNTQKFIFNFNTCLENAGLDEKKTAKLKDLNNLYKERKPLSNEEEDIYISLAKEFTNKILKN